MREENFAKRESQGPDFVWRRTATDAEAISLLVNRFPLLLQSDESEQELVELRAFYAYGRFADEIVQKATDRNLMRASCWIHQ